MYRLILKYDSKLFLLHKHYNGLALSLPRIVSVWGCGVDNFQIHKTKQVMLNLPIWQASACLPLILYSGEYLGRPDLIKNKT